MKRSDVKIEQRLDDSMSSLPMMIINSVMYSELDNDGMESS